MNGDLVMAVGVSCVLHVAAILAVDDPLRTPASHDVAPRSMRVVVDVLAFADRRLQRPLATPASTLTPPPPAAEPAPPTRPHPTDPGPTPFDVAVGPLLPHPLERAMSRRLERRPAHDRDVTALPAPPLPSPLPPPPARPPALATPGGDEPGPARSDTEGTLASRPPVALANRLPSYPPAARRRALEGVVELDLHVLTDGTCGEVRVAVSSGHAVLDRAAVRAAGKWRFEPATVQGRPVPRWATIPIEFKLQPGEGSGGER